MTTPFKQTTRSATLAVTIAGRLETLDLGDGLHAYKRTVETTDLTEDGDDGMRIRIEGLDKTGWAVATQGVVNDANLARLVAGQEFEDAGLTLCEPRLLEHLRRDGFHQHRTEGYQIFDAHERNVYDALMADPAAIERLVRVDHSSHSLFERNGLPLPTPILFSYLDGRMSNDAYDLEAAAKVLLARGDVQVFPRGSGWRSEPDYAGTAATAAECITDIPHYNADEEGGRTQTIHFAYRPSVEDFRTILSTGAPKGKKRLGGLHEAIFDLDMLGLRAAGAARTKTYYGDPEAGA